MKCNAIFYCMMAVITVGFSGCGRLIDLCKETIPQSATYSLDKKIIKQYTKSVRFYDEFQMIAMFDVLWLSDDIRTMYGNHYSLMHGSTIDATTEAVRRQLQANEKMVSFYILSLRADPLHISNPTWIVYLEVDEHRYQPQEIKFVELLPFYITVFGKLCTNHKQACEVKFSRFDQEGRDIMQAKRMSVRFGNQKYYGSVSWEMTKKVTDQKGDHV